MMDTYKVSATGLDEEGDECEFSILVRERDSEVIPHDEKCLMLAMSANRKGVSLRYPYKVEIVDWPDHRNDPQPNLEPK